MSILRNAIVNVLRAYADKIESGNSNLTEDECLELTSQIAHVNLTKQEVAERYGISPRTVDRKESEGILPPSHSARVNKKNWYLDELIKFEHIHNQDVNS